MPNDSLPVSLQLRLEEICAGFETSWKAAGSAATAPRIEEHLSAVGDAGRPVLLRELLRLDVHYRRRHGENPDADYYIARCPADAQSVRALFAELFGVFQPLESCVPVADNSHGTLRPGSVAQSTIELDGSGAAVAPAEPQGAASKYPAIANYEILTELGRGGMGVVYKARQTALKRHVALKMILSGDYASPDELARFRREAEAIARLCHPHIVQVYEVGEYDGRPFFSLEYVDGGTLATKLRESLSGPKEAAALVEKLARAMHAVHQCSVVHRDLKPANVLLTADGTPKISDFGLAKKLDDDAGQTCSGAIIGTPSYMAPEQASGGPERATPLADVYALGAILYECLTGRPPFRAATVMETLEQVVQDEPVPPRRLNAAVPRDLETVCLKCLGKDPAKRYGSAEALADDLRHWLHGEPIQARPVGRLEKLWRWCRRHPAPAAAAGIIVATVVTAFALIMQSRDQEAEAKDAALKLANANLELANKNGKLADDYHKAARKNAELAKDNDEKARKNAELAANNGQLAKRERGLRHEVQRQSASAYLTEGQYSCERGDVSRGTLLLAHSLELAHQGQATDLELACRTQLALWRPRLPRVEMLFPHADEVLAVAFSPDGRRILTGGADKTAVLWDARTGKQLGQPLRPEYTPSRLGIGYPSYRSPMDFSRVGSRPDGPPKHGGEVVAVAFSPDGRTLATGAGDPFYRGKAQLAGFGDSFRRGLDDLLPKGIDISRRMPRMGSSLDRGLRRLPPPPLWNAATGKPLTRTAIGDPVWAVAFSPDGRLLLTGGGPVEGRSNSRTGLGLTGRSRIGYDPLNPLGKRDDGYEAHLWDLTKGQHLRAFPHKKAVLAVAFSPDGRYVLTGSADRTAIVWEAATARPVGKPLAHDGPVLAVAFSPDGRMMLTCSQRSATQGSVQLWNTETREPLGPPLRHSRPVLTAAFSPDGRAIVTGSGDFTSRVGEAHLWSVATAKPLGAPLSHPGPVHSVAWSPDGRRIVTGCADHVARVWEAIPTPAVVRIGHHENVLAYAPDGRRVLLGTVTKEDQSRDRCGKVTLGDTSSGKIPLPVFENGVSSGMAVFSPDSRRILLEWKNEDDKTGALYLVDAGSGKRIGKPLPQPSGSVEAIAVSPDGHTILAGTSHAYAKKGEAIVGDARKGEIQRTFTFEAPVLSVVFSPDGRLAATGSGMPGTAQGEARLWDVQTGQCLHVLAHQGPVRVVLFSPDGRTLATAGEGRAAQLWDVASGKPRGPALAHNAPVRALAFSTDGKRLLTGSDDQTAQLWDAATGKAIGAPLTHRRPVRAVAISGDGRLLATGSDDRTARLWEANTGRSLEAPLAHQGLVVSVAFSGDGRTLLTRSVIPDVTVRRRVGDAWETTVGTPWKSTGRVWAVPAPVEGEPSSVVLRVQVATGMELDADSRLHTLEAAVWRERRGRLGKQGDATPAAAVLREWHRREAWAAEAAAEWWATLWHLERLGDDEPAAEDLHGRRGRAYAVSNRWAPAITELTKTLKPNDLRIELRYFRGLAYYALNQNDKALADFDDAIRIEPVLRHLNAGLNGVWMVWFRRGQTYFRLGQMDKASADFSEVLKRNPNHGLSLYGRGQAYAEMGNLEKAAADFAAALQRPGVPATVACDVAQARLQRNDKSGYREGCAQALKRFGTTEDPVLAANLAWTFSLAPDSGVESDQALRLANLAISQNPNSYAAHLALGAALYRAGKYQQATERFTAAMKLSKQPLPSAWLLLALAHQRLKQPEEAKQWLDKARAWIDQARKQKAAEEGNNNKTRAWDHIPWNDRLALTVLLDEANMLRKEAEKN
jgi:WD40 repeat protein/tetratricopeptide (TPR) repeat protein/tRNA A-37 threonylcarbamoyl transferase component Bud32